MAFIVSGAAAAAESTAFVEGAAGCAPLLHAASPAIVSNMSTMVFMEGVISSESTAG